MDREEQAMKHLGDVLQMLAELHEDDRCQAFEDALGFYNQENPNLRVEPIDGYSTRLVQYGPLDRIRDALSPSS